MGQHMGLGVWTQRPLSWLCSLQLGTPPQRLLTWIKQGYTRKTSPCRRPRVSVNSPYMSLTPKLEITSSTPFPQRWF